MTGTPTLDTALQVLEEKWRSRVSQREMNPRGPDLICRVVETISPDKSDPCLYCPLSINNGDMGCPEAFQLYREARNDDEAALIAQEVVAFVARVRSSI